MRIIQELVPGKQVTLAHIIANPDASLYEKNQPEAGGAIRHGANAHGAIGIVTMSPAESTIIAADVGIKSAGVTLGFVDRVSGTLILPERCPRLRQPCAQLCSLLRRSSALAYVLLQNIKICRKLGKRKEKTTQNKEMY